MADGLEDAFMERFFNDYGLWMSLRGKAIETRTCEHFVGTDYSRLFDEAYDLINDRGYIFLQSMSYDFKNFSYGDPVTLRLRREPRLKYDKEEKIIGIVPYGAWFEWEITAKVAQQVLNVKRMIIDPTRTRPEEFQGKMLATFYKDSIEDNLPFSSEEEMRKHFRENTLIGLSQITDFSHLTPQPPIISRNRHSILSNFVKSRWSLNLHQVVREG